MPIRCARNRPRILSTWGAMNVNFLTPGESDAACGRAILEYAGRAIDMAVAGEVDAVVACPQTQSSIKSAGIEFDGYPSYVARRTEPTRTMFS